MSCNKRQQSISSAVLVQEKLLVLHYDSSLATFEKKVGFLLLF